MYPLESQLWIFLSCLALFIFNTHVCWNKCAPVTLNVLVILQTLYSFLFIYLLFEKNQSKKPAVGIRSELFQLISKTDAIFSTFFSGAPSYRTRHKQ